jgi:hypothetical protein
MIDRQQRFGAALDDDGRLAMQVAVYPCLAAAIAHARRERPFGCARHRMANRLAGRKPAQAERAVDVVVRLAARRSRH